MFLKRDRGERREFDTASNLGAVRMVKNQGLSVADVGHGIDLGGDGGATRVKQYRAELNGILAPNRIHN
jgi:hypothetical protein